MFDTMLGIVAATDWITPLAGFVGDFVNGPSHTFLIPYGGCPLSGRDVGRLLGKRGVRCWGLQVIGGTLMVSVRLNQARWAQHLLEQAGVPIENPLPAQDRTRRAQGRRPGKKRAWRRPDSRRKSEVGAIVDSVNEILNTRLF